MKSHVQSRSNPPVKVNDRVVVNGNLQPYAEAYVDECSYNDVESRWVITLRWPNSPSPGSKSRVYGHDMNKAWYPYKSAS